MQLEKMTASRHQLQGNDKWANRVLEARIVNTKKDRCPMAFCLMECSCDLAEEA
jgi:hypothetical protein